MTDKRINNDPTVALSEANKALAQERVLNTFLDRIVAQEKVRAEASQNIQDIWIEVRRAGLNVESARRKLIYRAIAA